MTNRQEKLSLNNKINKWIKHDIIIISRYKNLNSSAKIFTADKGDNMSKKEDIILNH